MQRRTNCQKHIWLLSGTGEGHPLAESLIMQGWRVTVSVVSLQASSAYADLSLEELTIGPLQGVNGVKIFLDKARRLYGGFDWVVDATHPFATLISSYLRDACKEYSQPLIRFERSLEEVSGQLILNSFNELTNFKFKDKRFLIALGSRCLKDAANAAYKAGAKVYARVLPTKDGILKALNSSVPANHLAILKPLLGYPFGAYEAALCRRWKITDVVCRQSGGPSEKLWKEVCNKHKLRLWMISRPLFPKEVETFFSFKDLLDRIDPENFQQTTNSNYG